MTERLKVLVSKTGELKGSAGSNPARSASLKVYSSERLDFSKQKAWEADVVILSGRILKNRDGKFGQNIGGSIFIWDEKAV